MMHFTLNVYCWWGYWHSCLKILHGGDFYVVMQISGLCKWILVMSENWFWNPKYIFTMCLNVPCWSKKGNGCGKPGRGLMVIHTLISSAQEVLYPQLCKNYLPVSKQTVKSVKCTFGPPNPLPNQIFTSYLDDISKKYSRNLKYFM